MPVKRLISSFEAWGRECEPVRIPLPSIPAGVFRITDYGAKGDGKTLNTEALRRTVEACRNAGGGTVLIPPGRFLTGPFTLASRMELRVEKGAVLLFSDNPADYALRTTQFEPCLFAADGHDIAITGEGAIDGQGKAWWERFLKTKTAVPAPPHRPFMIVLSRCERVLVRDISLVNAPMFHLVPDRCRDVRIESVHITAPADAPNTDGVDPSGWNLLIRGCTFDVGDDCIAVKPSGPGSVEHPSCENILIADCTFRHGHGMSIGGQTPGGLRNMTVQNCTFQSTDIGIRMKAARGSGGLVENVNCENLAMKDVKTALLITSYYPRIPADPGKDPAQPIGKMTPVWRHIHIRNVTAEGGKTAGRILGLPEMPVSDVVLTNVRLSARKGMEIVHARGIRFERSQVRAETGAPVVVQDAEVSGIEAAREDE